MSKKTLAIDFDGVLHFYRKGVHDRTIYDKPVPWAIAAVTEYVKHFDVVIFSARCETQEGIDAMRKWMTRWGFPPDVTFSFTKPSAEIFIDDRGFHFQGVFPTVKELDEFVPWWRSAEHVKRVIGRAAEKWAWEGRDDESDK